MTENTKRTITLENRYDVIIIGAGPAGLAAALGARENGAKNVLIVDRDKFPGGILQQCIHPGFGLKRFQKEMTGPEYAHAYIAMVEGQEGIHYALDTFAYSINDGSKVTISNPSTGIRDIQAGAIVLAMGCREASRGSISIPGYRPAGIFSAGTAQRLINIDRLMPGKEVVILGSGDIGLIMARRFTLEGAKVKAVVEILPYPGGLNKNVVQCIEDFDIPMHLSHTVTFIEGKERVSGVKIARVDSEGNPDDGTEKYIKCDTLLLSIGLIPENELSRAAGIELDPVTMGPVVDNLMQASRPGVFAGGNTVHVYDLVDYVSQDSYIAGANAAIYSSSGFKKGIGETALEAGEAVKYIVPRSIKIDAGPEPNNIISMRVKEYFKKTGITITADGKKIGTIKKPYAVPQEMLRIDLTRFVKDFQDKKRLTLDVEEIRK